MSTPVTQASDPFELKEEDFAGKDAAPKPKKRQGFAAMDPDKVREIARMGGKAAHAAGTAHEFTSEEAREAGRKGGNAPRRRRGKARASDGT